MKTNALRIASFVLILVMFITTFVYPKQPASRNTIYISLAYPQLSNAPKRELKKLEKAALAKGEVFINIVGIKPGQLNHPTLYVEYFLDNELIYSTEDKKQSSLGFILDTRLYPDGNHTLIVNLWDKDGPSAIGAREIIIQNQTQNED